MKLYTITGLLLFCVFFSFGQATIPLSGMDELTSCDTSFVDYGGVEGNYLDDSDGSLIIYPEGGNKKIHLSFSN